MSDGHGLTLAAIARQMGISRERVGQKIQQEAIKHLRRRKNRVQDYIAS